MSQVGKAPKFGDVLSTEHLMSDLGERTARGGATAIAAQVARMFVQLVIAAVTARLLAPADFGLVAMATTLTGFVAIFTDLGLSAATIQRREIDQATISALFYVNVGVGCGLMVLCAVAAPLAAWLFRDPRVLWVTIALGISIPITAAGAQHGALLQRGMRWAEMQWTPVLSQAAGGIVGILLAWLAGVGYWALVVQAWLTAIVSTGLYWWFSGWRPDLTFRWGEARSALGFGLHLTGFNLMNYFHRQFDNALIGWRWGAAELGHYTRAYTLLTLPLALVSAPIASAVIPALSRVQDDPERWSRGFLKAFGALNLISAGLTAILIVTAEPLVEVVFGPQWSKAGHVFSYLAISMFAATPVNATSWIYVSLGQTRRMFRWALLITPFYVAAYVIGLPYGAAGVALCYSIAMCLVCVPYLVYATAKAPIGLWPVLKTALLPATIGASIALTEVVFRWMPSGGSALMRVLLNSSIASALYFVPALLLLVYGKTFTHVRTSIQEHVNRLCVRGSATED